MAGDTRFSIPKAGLDGLKSLIELGSSKIEQLSNFVRNLQPLLSLPELTKKISFELGISELNSKIILEKALLPLNDLRASSKLPLPEFFETLVLSLKESNHKNWEKSDTEKWQSISRLIEPLIEQDNFLYLFIKSNELLINRPNIIRKIKLLTEMRPVYSEDAESIKALIMTKTLVIDYNEGNTKNTIYFSMDNEDLNSLANEINRALIKEKSAISYSRSWEIHPLALGEIEE